LALALNAPAEENNQPSTGKGTKARRASTVQSTTGGHTGAAISNSGKVNTHRDVLTLPELLIAAPVISNSGKVNTHRDVSTQRFHQRATNPRINSSAVVGDNTLRSNRINTSRELRTRNANERIRGDVATSRE